MSVAQVFAAQPSVLGAHLVTIEADLSRGLYSFSIVGLPGKAVEEAKDRVSAAIKNSGFKSPKSQNHKVVVSFAPADLKKEGPLFDLPIAISYLVSADEIYADNRSRILIGELALDGTLRGVHGVLPVVREAAALGFSEVIVPYENREESALIPEIKTLAARSLTEVVRHIDTRRDDHQLLAETPPTQIPNIWDETSVRFDDIRGQETAKRGLTIAAAGRHNVMLVGPPGTGKTMLARAFQALLPPLSVEEALEVTSIHSVAGTLEYAVSARPPFRAPHHTASHTSLVGGGTTPRPGEVTLAHRGVLFLDEFPEFERRSLDALRQPLEDRVVSISRVHSSALFPADFILVAALNPSRDTNDTEDYASLMREHYKHKISGPILDRIDLWLEVPRVDLATLTADQQNNSTAEMEGARSAVAAARELQKTRFAELGISANAEVTARDIDTHMNVTKEARTLLRSSAEKLDLSPRSYHRLVKVARTIADLAEKEQVENEHVLEALQYRVKL